MKNRDATTSPTDAMAGITEADPRQSRDATTALTFDSAEYMHLRARLVALESLVTSLLSQLAESQRDGARHMANSVLPRAGATEHRITIDAVQQINHLVDLAAKVRRS